MMMNRYCNVIAAGVQCGGGAAVIWCALFCTKLVLTQALRAAQRGVMVFEYKCDKYRLDSGLAKANFASMVKVFRKKCDREQKSVELG